MKLTFLLLGALLLASAPAFAQQMVSPPGAISASPESTAEAKPEAAPSPETVEKATVPPEAAARRETPAPKALPSVRKASPVAQPVKPKPAPKSETAGTEPVMTEPQPQGKRNVEAALKELENKWEKAIVAHNAAEEAALVAPDFAGINSKGKFVNKLALISELKNDKDSYQSARNEKLNVHVYGPNVAVVTGSVRSKGTTKGGQPFDRTYRYTDTWVLRSDQWQCVASQDSLITGN